MDRLNRIRVLDATTVTKMAAGEVIDRPVSIVKELLENSLDAGARSIEISIESGGLKRICVQDNGSGISRDDLALAPHPHATSKIQALSDIDHVLSMGFRGEALASIAHVASLDITSRTSESDTAYRITASERDISEPTAVAMETGTRVEVRDLFHTLPVRRKYLKSAGTEFSHIQDLIQKFAVLHTTIDFTLRHNDKEVLNTRGIADPTARIATCFGKALAPALIEISYKESLISVSGWISNPTVTFSNRNRQVVALNGRIVTLPLFQKLIADRYRDVIPARRFPFVCLNIDTPPGLLDINVHPQKREVRLLRSDVIFDTVSSALKSAWSAEHSIDQSIPPSAPPSFASVTSSPPSPTFSQFRDPDTASIPPDMPLFTAESLEQPIQFDYFQVLSTYLFVKTDDAAWILDQHAVHERILYEKIKATEAGNTDVQPLLISEVVDLDPIQMNTFRTVQPFLSDIGFDIDEFGPDQIVIRKVPAILTDVNLGDFLQALLEIGSTERLSTEHVIAKKKDALQMRACKAAIKAGKTMGPIETQRLIQDFVAAPSNYTCPHGRPLYIKLTGPELEKLFLRS